MPLKVWCPMANLANSVGEDFSIKFCVSIKNWDGTDVSRGVGGFTRFRVDYYKGFKKFFGARATVHNVVE